MAFDRSSHLVHCTINGPKDIAISLCDDKSIGRNHCHRYRASLVHLCAKSVLIGQPNSDISDPVQETRQGEMNAIPNIGAKLFRYFNIAPFYCHLHVF